MILRTELTTDGEPVPVDEIATVTLTLHPAFLRVYVEAPFHGDPAPPAPPGSLDGLWNYEVVELFVAAANGPDWEYTEVELGPHGHSLALRLNGIRKRSPKNPLAPLPFSAVIAGRCWTGTADVPLGWLPGVPAAAWRLNACAIHGSSPRRYLTAARLQAPLGQPDFHRPAEFLGWAMRGGA